MEHFAGSETQPVSVAGVIVHDTSPQKAPKISKVSMLCTTSIDSFKLRFRNAIQASQRATSGPFLSLTNMEVQDTPVLYFQVIPFQKPCLSTRIFSDRPQKHGPQGFPGCLTQSSARTSPTGTERSDRRQVNGPTCGGSGLVLTPVMEARQTTSNDLFGCSVHDSISGLVTVCL